jgi:hypothetical protein
MWAYERIAGCWQWVWRTRAYWRGLRHVAGVVTVCGAVSGSVPHALAELPVVPAGLPSAQMAGWSPWATLDDNTHTTPVDIPETVLPVDRPAATPVPEPGTWALLVIGALAVVVLRRRPTA